MPFARRQPLLLRKVRHYVRLLRHVREVEEIYSFAGVLAAPYGPFAIAAVRRVGVGLKVKAVEVKVRAVALKQ